MATATNDLGHVRLLVDVASHGPANHMNAGEVHAVIPSPNRSMKSFTWVQGKQFAIRLLPGEYEKLPPDAV
jgi:hypothetical protein